MRLNLSSTVIRTALLFLGSWIPCVCTVASNGEDLAEGAKHSAVDEVVDSSIGGQSMAIDLDGVFDEFSTYFEVEEHIEGSDNLSDLRLEAPPVIDGSGLTEVGSVSEGGNEASLSASPDEGGRDVADFVGDTSGEGGESEDDSTWVRTYADTMVRSHGYPSHSAERASQTRPGYTSFENGYIPKFEDDLKLVDEAPYTDDYAQAENYSRLPDSWSLPPGAAAGRPNQSPASVNGPMYEPYQGYESAGYRGSAAFRGNNYYDSPYGSSYYDPRDPYNYNGPYSYRLGPYDRAINDRILYEDANYTFQGDLPFITRKFDPDQAHFKLGGLYFQAVSTEVGVLFSDYDGPQRFRRGEEDGFLSFVGFRLRAAGRISPSFYVTTDVNLIYLIGANELAVRSASAGSPFLRLDYRTEAGPWDLHIYDYLGTVVPFLFGADALERAGRYQFGFAGFEGGTNDYSYEPVLYNRFGVEAQRWICEDWRLSLTASQSDYWRFSSDVDDDHSNIQTLGARVSYEGMEIPFSPWAQYRATSNDYYDTAYHILTAVG